MGNIANNPNYNAAMELIQQNNGDAKAAFYNLAKEKGINPEDVLKMARQRLL